MKIQSQISKNTLKNSKKTPKNNKKHFKIYKQPIKNEKINVFSKINKIQKEKTNQTKRNGKISC